MTKAQEELKDEITKIDDEAMIEKIRIFIMGIFAQQKINEKKDERTQHFFEK